MNNVNLVGRIGQMKASTTKNGKHQLFFTVGVKDIHTENTDWIPCVAWNKDAENIAKYMKKGYRVAVTGNLSTYRNQNNDYSMKVNVVPGGIEFLTSKKEAEGINSQQQFENQSNVKSQQKKSQSFDMAPQPDKNGFFDTDDVPY